MSTGFLHDVVYAEFADRILGSTYRDSRWRSVETLDSCDITRRVCQRCTLVSPEQK
jgi:hypothetical protein